MDVAEEISSDKKDNIKELKLRRGPNLHRYSSPADLVPVAGFG